MRPLSQPADPARRRSAAQNCACVDRPDRRVLRLRSLSQDRGRPDRRRRPADRRRLRQLFFRRVPRAASARGRDLSLAGLPCVPGSSWSAPPSARTTITAIRRSRWCSRCRSRCCPTCRRSAYGSSAAGMRSTARCGSRRRTHCCSRWPRRPCSSTPIADRTACGPRRFSAAGCACCSAGRSSPASCSACRPTSRIWR